MRLCKMLIIGAGVLGSMVTAGAALEHPFLICKRSEFAALRARASAEPWKSMKSAAISASSAGVNTTSGTTLQQYVGAAALAYILDTGNAAAHKNRVRDAILNKLDNITFDPSMDWGGVVPPMAAAFLCILGLDVVYDDLTASEISSCEAKIKSKIDLIPKTGSWQAARWGAHRTWDIYKGTRTSRDDEYLNHILSQMTADGVGTAGPAYAFARIGGSDNRLQKSAYMDVLEYTGLDNRYYSNTAIRGFYRWLYGSSITPGREYHMFADTSPLYAESNGAMLWRIGRFDHTAGQYAAWLYKNETPPGHLLSYVLMTSTMPAPVVPRSALFMKGGAVFRETADSPNSLGSALLNLTSNDEWHTHEEVNAVSASGYGSRLLVNAGRLGDVCRPSYMNNTLAINGARHSRRTGGGLEEGVLGDGFDYACGVSGSALSDDSFKRSLIQMHARDGANGYFLVADEVDADNGETAHAYLQTASESQITEVTAKAEYQATINHHEKSSGVKLSVFYATPPTVVNRALVASGDLARDPAAGSHYRLESRYATDGSGDAQTLTVLFPHNSSHAKATMARRSGSGFTGASVAQGGNVTDYAYVSGGTADCSDNGLTFRGKLAFLRKEGSDNGLYFSRKGTKFRAGTVGFEASGPISVLMDDKDGKVTGAGADVTFYHTGITGVSLDGTPVAVKSSGTGWCRVGVPAGTYDVILLTDGSTGPADTVAPALQSVTAGADDGTVLVVFDETVDPVSAGTASNYTVSGLTVSSAALGTDGKTVTLAVSTMSDGTEYTLSVSNVKDLAAVPNTIVAGTQAMFEYDDSIVSTAAWQNFPLGTQNGSFIFTYDATPLAATCNALVTLSAGDAGDYTDNAVLVRFNNLGKIDARNGADYAALQDVSYTAGTEYRFRIAVDVADHTYSVYVTPAGGSEITLATDYAFRTEQNSVSSLDTWNMNDDTGSFKVNNAEVSTGGTSRIRGNGFVPVPNSGNTLYSISGKRLMHTERTGIYVVRDQRTGVYKRMIVLD